MDGFFGPIEGDNSSYVCCAGLTQVLTLAKHTVFTKAHPQPCLFCKARWLHTDLTFFTLYSQVKNPENSVGLVELSGELMHGIDGRQ